MSNSVSAADVQAESEEGLVQFVPPDARNHRHSVRQAADGGHQPGATLVLLFDPEEQQLGAHLHLLFPTSSSTKKTVRRR